MSPQQAKPTYSNYHFQDLPNPASISGMFTIIGTYTQEPCPLGAYKAEGQDYLTNSMTRPIC